MFCHVLIGISDFERTIAFHTPLMQPRASNNAPANPIAPGLAGNRCRAPGPSTTSRSNASAP